MDKQDVMKTSDIIKYVEKLTGHVLNKDEGVQHGDSKRDITKVTVTWIASPEAIHFAGKAGCELLIAHESLYYPYDVIIAENPPENWREWKVNKQKYTLLEQYNLSFLRIHCSLDEICIFDDFAELFNLGEPVVADGLVKVYEISPLPLHALVKKVKEQMNMTNLRVADAGDMNRIVSKVGLPWGGVGLYTNVAYQQQLIEHECDVFIAGESDNYGFRFAAESGIPMIETSHELSENPGIRNFTEILSRTFPNVQFSFYENECIWHIE